MRVFYFVVIRKTPERKDRNGFAVWRVCDAVEPYGVRPWPMIWTPRKSGSTLTAPEMAAASAADLAPGLAGSPETS